MICEEPEPETVKPICRCKNCIFRQPDTVPWPEALELEMAENQNENEPKRASVPNSRESRYSELEIEQPNVRKEPEKPASPVQQPTILLIVVNKPPEGPYSGQGPRLGRGYSGPGPSRGPPNYYYQPPPPPGYGYDRGRFDGYRPPYGDAYQGAAQYGQPYQDGGRGRPSAYRNRDEGRRRPPPVGVQESRRYSFGPRNDNVSDRSQRGFCNCRCENKQSRRGNDGHRCMCVSDDGGSMRSNPPRPRNCRCVERRKSLTTESNQPQPKAPMSDSAAPLEADMERENLPKKKNTYRCVPVPICISQGMPSCCQCTQSVAQSEEEEGRLCCCQDTGECICLNKDEAGANDEYVCECDMTELEQTLRSLMPNAECMCYFQNVAKKKKRKKRKKQPRVIYDRFANPPFVLEPKPPCLDCCRYTCCHPVGQSCYSQDYGNGCWRPC